MTRGNNWKSVLTSVALLVALLFSFRCVLVRFNARTLLTTNVAGNLDFTEIFALLLVCAALCIMSETGIRSHPKSGASANSATFALCFQ